MDYSWKEILTGLGGSGVTVTGLFFVFKWLYEAVTARREKKKTAEEKAYEQIWKLYEDAKKTIETLEKKIVELESGNSLSRPTLSKIYQAVRKLGRQIEILDSIFIKEFMLQEDSEDVEKTQLREAIKKEMDILWQKFDELEKCLP